MSHDQSWGDSGYGDYQARNGGMPWPQYNPAVQEIIEEQLRGSRASTPHAPLGSYSPTSQPYERCSGKPQECAQALYYEYVSHPKDEDCEGSPRERQLRDQRALYEAGLSVSHSRPAPWTLIFLIMMVGVVGGVVLLGDGHQLAAMIFDAIAFLVIARMFIKAKKG